MATQTSDVDAVIAALRAVLRDAELTSGTLPTNIVNRWIGQLPGAWRGRWRRLKLRGNAFGNAPRDAVIAHVRATIAYLEAQREALGQKRRWWRFSRAQKRPTARADLRLRALRPRIPRRSRQTRMARRSRGRSG
jgi:hypothetical protein